MRTTSMLPAALLALAVMPALAQASSIVNVLGTVEKIDATSITVTNDDGGTAESYRLVPNVLVVRNQPATLADIRPDDFVASAAVRQADGRLHSTELRIFPEAMRGLGEGQRPMHDARNQAMTNATVTGTAIVDGSNKLRVKFAGGESELIVDPGIPVTRITTADIGQLSNGVEVRLRGIRNADGASINRVTIR